MTYDLIVACVRVGTVHNIDRVTKLRNTVAKHLTQPYRMMCLTDQPERCSDIEFVDISVLDLRGSMARMALFEPAWREQSKVIHLGLNISVLDDLAPLVEVPGEFSILESHDRLLGVRKYNSDVMVIGGGTCGFVWKKFDQWGDHLVGNSEVDAVIETLYPSAPMLQRLLPKWFFKTSVVTRD